MPTQTKPTYENFRDSAERAKRHKCFLVVVAGVFGTSSHPIPGADWQMDLGRHEMIIAEEGYKAVLVLAGIGE